MVTNTGSTNETKLKLVANRELLFNLRNQQQLQRASSAVYGIECQTYIISRASCCNVKKNHGELTWQLKVIPGTPILIFDKHIS